MVERGAAALEEEPRRALQAVSEPARAASASRSRSERTAWPSRRCVVSSAARSSCSSGTTSAPAAVGVAARASAARSQSGVSCSCPTAETTGTGAAATARTTASALNGSRSSKLPPPRARTTTSTSGCAESAPRPATIASSAPAALDARLADDDLRRRKAPADRRHEVAARGRVGAGEDADRPRHAREPALARGREEPLGGEPALELLERDEVAADAHRARASSRAARARLSARTARPSRPRGRSRPRRAPSSRRSKVPREIVTLRSRPSSGPSA